MEKALQHYQALHIQMFYVQSILGLRIASLNLAPFIKTIYVSVNHHQFSSQIMAVIYDRCYIHDQLMLHLIMKY